MQIGIHEIKANPLKAISGTIASSKILYYIIEKEKEKKLDSL